MQWTSAVTCEHWKWEFKQYFANIKQAGPFSPYLAVFFFSSVSFRRINMPSTCSQEGIWKYAQVQHDHCLSFSRTFISCIPIQCFLNWSKDFHLPASVLSFAILATVMGLEEEADVTKKLPLLSCNTILLSSVQWKALVHFFRPAKFLPTYFSASS